MPKKIGIFASGRGSNAEALYQSMLDGTIDGDLKLILTDHKEAGIVDKARTWGIPLLIIERADYPSKEAFEEAQVQALAPYDLDVLVLAGYMRLLGPTLIDAYEGRILNIHPALLPSFPGLHAQGQAVAAGVKVAGCTVHFVDLGMDSGPIIMQNTVPVYASDTEESLAARLLPVEHKTYVEALALFCKDSLSIVDGIVHIANE
jgi:phosphoribosylglycinamide formyltransferase